MTTSLTQIPAQIVAGDSIDWLCSLPAYPASEGWTLHYVLLSQGKTPVTISTIASGSDHQATLGADITGAWPTATYRWTAFVTKGTERKTLGSGQVIVLPDPTTQLAAFDPRTENQKILDAITAVLAGELTNPLVKYKIAGREAERHSRTELLGLQAIYKHRVAVENGQAPFVGSIPIGFTSNYGIPGGVFYE